LPLADDFDFIRRDLVVAFAADQAIMSSCPRSMILPKKSWPPGAPAAASAIPTRGARDVSHDNRVFSTPSTDGDYARLGPADAESEFLGIPSPSAFFIVTAITKIFFLRLEPLPMPQTAAW
jgi:hypothetical protein